MAILEAAAAGLLVTSTNVGGVPEVLPRDLCILAEPEPQAIIDAVAAAVRRVRRSPVDRQAQHERVRTPHHPLCTSPVLPLTSHRHGCCCHRHRRALRKCRSTRAAVALPRFHSVHARCDPVVMSGDTAVHRPQYWTATAAPPRTLLMLACWA